MDTKILNIESKESELGTILTENSKTLASSKFQCDFIKDRVEGFLLSAIPAGKGKVKIEITVSTE